MPIIICISSEKAFLLVNLYFIKISNQKPKKYVDYD